MITLLSTWTPLSVLVVVIVTVYLGPDILLRFRRAWKDEPLPSPATDVAALVTILTDLVTKLGVQTEQMNQTADKATRAAVSAANTALAAQRQTVPAVPAAPTDKPV